MSKKDEAFGQTKETYHSKIRGLNVDAANHLIGRLATLVDALLQDERQAKAFKDTLKAIVWESESKLSEELRETLYSCRMNSLSWMTHNEWVQVEKKIGKI